MPDDSRLGRELREWVSNGGGSVDDAADYAAAHWPRFAGLPVVSQRTLVERVLARMESDGGPVAFRTSPPHAVARRAGRLCRGVETAAA